MDSTSDYYQNKVAVVTGGASGIGLALAEMMLSYGAKRVVLVDINDEDLKRETARLGLAHAGKVLGLRCYAGYDGYIDLESCRADFSDKGLLFTLSYWINMGEANPTQVASDLRRMIMHQLIENGIALSNMPIQLVAAAREASKTAAGGDGHEDKIGEK